MLHYWKTILAAWTERLCTVITAEFLQGQDRVAVGAVLGAVGAEGAVGAMGVIVGAVGANGVIVGAEGAIVQSFLW